MHGPESRSYRLTVRAIKIPMRYRSVLLLLYVYLHTYDHLLGYPGGIARNSYQDILYSHALQQNLHSKILHRKNH